MAKHDIVSFSSDGERILGVVIEHYVNPLDDFYVVYADYALHKIHSFSEDAVVILENVIIPACDEAIYEHRLKVQHFQDIQQHHKEMGTLFEAVSPEDAV